MSPAKPPIVIDIAGTPFERGRSYGQQCAVLVQENIEIYLRLFQHHVGLNRQMAISKAEMYIPAIERFSEDIMAEIAGIADGAGVNLREIVMLNARTELLSKVPLHECTSVAVIPPASLDDHVYLAQNWDWLRATKGHAILLKVTQPGKPCVTMFVEAGHVGKMGFNDAGLGLCVNWLEASAHSVGVPFIVLCRAILDSHELIDAINVLFRCKRASSANFLIAHDSGFAIDFETTPDDVDFIEPIDGLLIHTNHYLSHRLRTQDHGLSNRGGDSLVRRQLAVNLLRREFGAIDSGVLMKTLRNRDCGSYSICTFPEPGEPELGQWETLAGFILDLSAAYLYIANGNPSDTEYVQLKLRTDHT